MIKDCNQICNIFSQENLQLDIHNCLVGKNIQN